MHSTKRSLIVALAVTVQLVVAGPLAAQQYIGPRRQSAPPQRSSNEGRQPAGNRQPGGSSQYPVRPAAGNNGGAGQAPQASAQAVRPVAPQVPFTLTPAEQALIDQILRKWEQQSDRVGTFTCKFSRWEVNETFGPAQFKHVLSEAQGEIKFKKPDNGTYIIRKQLEWDKQKNNYISRTEGLDHWVCDGESIFEYNAEKKELVERELAPQMRGKAITEGPLPFVFGTKADQLKRRYWMRDVTPAEDVNKKIWLEAWPKYQRDAANFQHAIIMLNQSDFMPSALRIILPDGKNKQDYVFSSTQVNNPLAILKGDFLPPMKPFGWTKVFIPAQASEQVAPPGQAPAQAAKGPRLLHGKAPRFGPLAPQRSG